MSDASKFNEDYYMRGVESGVSNYQDYKWQADRTISMVTHLKRFLGIKEGEFTLEVGASRGFYVKALRMLGVEAFGYDISEWAVANCDPDVRPFLSNHLKLQPLCYDVVWSKDTFEHIAEEELKPLVMRLLVATRRKMFVIVPLAKYTGGLYVHAKEENDKTHVNRWTLHDWISFFQGCSSSFVVNGSYRYPGLKPGAYEVDFGYGFFTLERI